MYRSWLEDLVEKHKFERDYSILTGSFLNLEMAQNMISAENPDHKSSDEDFDKSIQIVADSRDKEEDGQRPMHRRRRRRQGVKAD